MIYAKNADALCYRGIHKNLDLALEHITPEFLSSLEDNVRVPLDGDRVYCTRFTYETIPLEEGFFEAHRRYLDIHIMLSGSERVDVTGRTSLRSRTRRSKTTSTPTAGTPGTQPSCAPATSWSFSRATHTA